MTSKLEQFKIIAEMSPTNQFFDEGDPRRIIGKSPAPQFKAEEVWAVARALLENSTRVDDAGRNALFCCNYCQEYQYYDWKTYQPKAPLVHEPGCPVPIARDLLTGSPDAKA